VGWIRSGRCGSVAPSAVEKEVADALGATCLLLGPCAASTRRRRSLHFESSGAQRVLTCRTALGNVFIARGARDGTASLRAMRIAAGLLSNDAAG